jgi:hypothetical protein
MHYFISCRSCSFDGSVKVWDYQYNPETGKSGKVLQEFTHTEQFRSLAYANWGTRKVILVGTNEAAILAFSLTNNNEEEESKEENDEIASIVSSADQM